MTSSLDTQSVCGSGGEDKPLTEGRQVVRFAITGVQGEGLFVHVHQRTKVLALSGDIPLPVVVPTRTLSFRVGSLWMFCIKCLLV
jgi:hypothetical protein